MLTLRAEHERAVAFVDDRLGLDVVLVADLADDLLEQILEVTRPGGAAVLVDDDGHLHLLALEFLQQLRHALGLRHERGRPHERGDRCASSGGAGQLIEILHEDEADDVVEILLVDTGMREYSCSRNSARSSSIVASARIATMSGRGVMTSRTSVSPKSTIDCSSRRSSPSISPAPRPASRYGCAASPALLRRSLPRAGALAARGGRRRSGARALPVSGCRNARRRRTAAAAPRARARGCGRTISSGSTCSNRG